MGSSAYEEETMGQPAREAFRDLRSLGAKTIGVVEVGDCAIGNEAQVSSIQEIAIPAGSSCACGSASSDGCCQANEDENEEEEEYFSDEEEQGEPEVMDLEDIGDSMMAEEKKTTELREMVTPSQAAALKKEGYKLIGTHSAVKLCRWTKHQLRGRGGCYKHTFYGITSYQCMEATPSLACANKCTN
jgi:tRNA wybutosine-synthesizing protein 1